MSTDPEVPVTDYPIAIAPVDHVEPVPRRIRAVLGGENIVDTTNALYVWEWSAYPQYYIPLGDVRTEVLIDEGITERNTRGDLVVHGLRLGPIERPQAAKVVVETSTDALRDTVRFEWSALDAWYEEDERVFVHPRNPYTRVDALRSTRPVRVELKGVVLAESTSPVMVFETGLPTRYYLNRTDVDFSHLESSETVTECPYKGITSGYWSARVEDRAHPDIAWTYDFPTRQVLPIAGLIAFYNERVDLIVDGRRLERPKARIH
jgi:uncharacterized protein (DUF427 family)